MTVLETSRRDGIRADLLIVAGMVAEGARVLDVGCGDGTLLHFLTRTKNVDGRGIEISQRGVNSCVAHGLPVVQGDADTDLRNYPYRAFDYVILSQTLQATRRPREVLEHLLRIGRQAIVSFPNFGYWRLRWQLILRGRMPTTRILDAPWYETSNIHLCTIRDFVALCREMDIRIDRSLTVDGRGNVRINAEAVRGNLLGEQAVFLLSRPNSGAGGASRLPAEDPAAE